MKFIKYTLLVVVGLGLAGLALAQEGNSSVGILNLSESDLTVRIQIGNPRHDLLGSSNDFLEPKSSTIPVGYSILEHSNYGDRYYVVLSDDKINLAGEIGYQFLGSGIDLSISYTVNKESKFPTLLVISPTEQGKLSVVSVPNAALGTAPAPQSKEEGGAFASDDRDSDAFAPYFHIKRPGTLKSTVHIGSWLYNQMPGFKGRWERMSTVKDPTHGRGPVIISQVPDMDIFESLLRTFPFQGEEFEGLVVSCNDHFELAAMPFSKPLVGRIGPEIITPEVWAANNYHHYHLHFADFSTSADIEPLKGALQAMTEAHMSGKPVLVHCKAGRSRSGIVVVLFDCLTGQEFSKRLYEAQQLFLSNQDEEQLNRSIAQVLGESATQMQQRREQLSVSDKMGLAHSFLSMLLKDPNAWTFSDDSGIRIVPSELSTKAQFMKELSQSLSFKKAWTHMFKDCAGTGARFEALKGIVESFHKDPHGTCTLLDAILERTPSEVPINPEALRLREVLLNAKPKLTADPGGNEGRRRLLEELHECALEILFHTGC